MGLSDVSFAGGVKAAREIIVRGRERLNAIAARSKELAADDSPEGNARFYAALREVQGGGGPLWQQICGFGNKNEVALDPGERRAGIRRLLRVVERMFRDELKVEDIDSDGGTSKLGSGENSYAGRAVVWEPLHEICVYLQISKAKLNALSLQRTGLRVSEVCDCIRVEGTRTSLREKFRPLVREWMEKMKKRDAKAAPGDDLVNAAWQFVKWMRGGGRCETRKKYALELGMTSRERLDRAVMVCERDTLEAIEIAVAMRVIQEGVGTPHGAGCDEVGEGCADGEKGACVGVAREGGDGEIDKEGVAERGREE